LGEIALNIRNLRISNSVFDIAMLSKGGYGAVMSRSSKIWDNVAQQIVSEEAGAKYTDFYGRLMDYSNPLTRAKQNFTFCAASPTLHEQLQDIVNSK